MNFFSKLYRFQIKQKTKKMLEVKHFILFINFSLSCRHNRNEQQRSPKDPMGNEPQVRQLSYQVHWNTLHLARETGIAFLIAFFSNVYGQFCY